MVVKRYAVIKDGLVENVIVLDLDDDYDPGTDRSLVESNDAHIGVAYDGSKFSEPVKPAPTQLEQLAVKVAAGIANLAEVQEYLTITDRLD